MQLWPTWEFVLYPVVNEESVPYRCEVPMAVKVLMQQNISNHRDIHSSLLCDLVCYAVLSLYRFLELFVTSGFFVTHNNAPRQA